MHYFISIRWML